MYEPNHSNMNSTSLDHIINLLVRKRDNFGNKHHKHTPNTMVYIVHWYKYALYHSYKFELEYEINSLPSLFEYFERSKRKFRKTVISNFMNAIVTENWVVSFYPQVLHWLLVICYLCTCSIARYWQLYVRFVRMLFFTWESFSVKWPMCTKMSLVLCDRFQTHNFGYSINELCTSLCKPSCRLIFVTIQYFDT